MSQLHDQACQQQGQVDDNVDAKDGDESQPALTSSLGIGHEITETHDQVDHAQLDDLVEEL